jgi:hypothetical protein
MNNATLTGTVTQRLAYSVRELSLSYTISAGFLRNEIRRRALPAHRLGRRVLVLKEDWESYLKRMSTGASA